MRTVKLLLLVWSIGFLGGVLLYLLRLLGVIRVKGYKSWKFEPDKRKGLVVLFRHPSMKETVILPMLLFPRYLLNLSLIPHQTPDTKWYRLLPFLHPMFIPVERGNSVGEIRALRAMKVHLRKGGILLVAPEGGRTWKGTEFKSLVDGRVCVIPRPENGIDLNTPVVRRFKRGVGSLLGDGTPVLVVWVEPRGRGLDIRIGSRQSFDASFPRDRIPDALEDIMLRLAEK